MLVASYPLASAGRLEHRFAKTRHSIAEWPNGATYFTATPEQSRGLAPTVFVFDLVHLGSYHTSSLYSSGSFVGFKS